MRIIQASDFNGYWNNNTALNYDDSVDHTVKEIIAAVRTEGDAAVRRFAARYDKSSPDTFEISPETIHEAAALLREEDAELISAMELAAEHIRKFSLKQKERFGDFEFEMAPGIITGQRVIPMERAAIYVPAGRFPLFSTVLMGLIPAFCAGVGEVILATPPMEDGFPDLKILAAAAVAEKIAIKNNSAYNARLRVFAIGGAQAIAAHALGTETIPRVDIIAGPGNKYVAAAKRILYGEVGIDFIAGPSDVLVVADGSGGSSAASPAELIAADMIAQAEHDPDARARALVPHMELAGQINAAIERQLATLSTAKTARASLDSGGLIIVYKDKEEAVHIANEIAPEHLELQTADIDWWIPRLKNYGSLFIGALSPEALGDYSAGINHTLPTSGSARFTGGLSVSRFLKTVTTLRCTTGEGFEKARSAAEILARAEGLDGHARSAAARK